MWRWPHDKAEAIRGYYQQQRGSLEAQNYAAELKLRAERKLGEMLKETEKNDGAKGLGSNQHLVRLQPATAPPKLSDLGIEKTQSSRWQKIADLPDEVFEQEIQEAKVNAEELTTARLLRVAQERKVEQKHEEVAEQRKLGEMLKETEKNDGGRPENLSQPVTGLSVCQCSKCGRQYQQNSGHICKLSGHRRGYLLWVFYPHINRE